MCEGLHTKDAPQLVIPFPTARKKRLILQTMLGVADTILDMSPLFENSSIVPVPDGKTTKVSAMATIFDLGPYTCESKNCSTRAVCATPFRLRLRALRRTPTRHRQWHPPVRPFRRTRERKSLTSKLRTDQLRLWRKFVFDTLGRPAKNSHTLHLMAHQTSPASLAKGSSSASRSHVYSDPTAVSSAFSEP